MEKEKKKRGRKPKNAIQETPDKSLTSTDADEFNNVYSTDIPQIIHISKISETTTVENSFENSFCNYSPALETPNAYNKEDTFLSIPSDIMNDKLSSNICLTVANNDWPQQTDVYCLWCCHPFTTTPIGIPIKITKNKFYCVGNFCSFECAAAHNYDISDINTNVWERFTLLNLLALKHDIDVPIKCAKPKTSLKIFGGSMEIKEFRDNSKKLLYFKNTYPMIPLCEQIEELCDSFNTNTAELFTIKKEDIKSKQTTIKEFC